MGYYLISYYKLIKLFIKIIISNKVLNLVIDNIIALFI